MVTLTAENVHDLMEAFFATYYADDILRTGDVQVSSQAIATGRKAFLAALRRLPEYLGANARGTVKEIINELSGPPQRTTPGPRMADGFTATQRADGFAVNPIDDQFLRYIIMVFLFGIPRKVPNYFGPMDEMVQGIDPMPGAEKIRNLARNLSVEWSRVIALRKFVQNYCSDMSTSERINSAKILSEIFPDDFLLTDRGVSEALDELDEAGGDAPHRVFSNVERIKVHAQFLREQRGKKFTLPETILVRDTESVKVSVSVASLETNPVAIMEQLTQVEHVELVRALVKMLRETAGGTVRKEEVK